MSFHHILEHNHLLIGILADVMTFGGALLLGHDAFVHLKEVQNKKIHDDFRKAFPNLPLDDSEESTAVVAFRWAISGALILLVGFILQILSRISEQ